ncbi:hypothetical protein NDU88_003797 [Pleurodeles waltl]|uniref:Reverse transcriptase n=1 Tax=Pleurodeles waltl TaxID=8319 RepID=A0AAV7MET0_PLEWA|nr:hypothetical protein NDU88_003797 [Pleurodeles waltl]
MQESYDRCMIDWPDWRRRSPSPEKQQCDTGNSRRILGDARAQLEEFYETARREVQHLGKYTVVRPYEKGEHRGATVAAIVRPCLDEDGVLKMQDEQGLPRRTAKQVSDQFCIYYANIYRSRQAHDDATAPDYLEYVGVTLLRAEHRENLMAPLRSWEIHLVLWHVPSGKAPGIDGLTVTFYKTY